MGVGIYMFLVMCLDPLDSEKTMMIVKDNLKKLLLICASFFL